MSKRFLNPYSFVRPLLAPEHLPPLSNETRDLHLMWHCPPPPHDRFTGISGEITCTMVAESPVFISDSDIVAKTGKDHKTYRFFNVDGEDIIPASSLRGSIRSIFEAATNSRWAVFSDQHLSYREITSNANKLVPGRMEYDAERKQWQVIQLKGEKGSLISAAQVPFSVLEESGFEHGQVCFAIMRRGKPALRVEKLMTYIPGQQPNIPAQYRDRQRYAYSAGLLCVTGRSIDKKNNERFFFRTTETMDDPIPVSAKVIDHYNELIKLAQEYHADTIAKLKSGKITQSKAALSRYHLGKLKDEQIYPENPLLKTEGYQFPVYVSYDERQGRVRYLAPVSIPRVLETRKFYDILREEGYGHLLPAESYDDLSPADRVFGWVHQDAPEDAAQRVAYRGRVRFSHAWVIGSDGKPAQPQKMEAIPLSILSAPKPTTTRFYVQPVEGIPADVNNPARTSERWQKYTDRKLSYSRRGNMLRGRKIYRQHQEFNLAEARRVDESDDQNRTVVGAHAPGTTYTFTVKFEDLQPVELGALLWSLSLTDEGWHGYHRLGYGKPLGLGSVQIAIDKVIATLPRRCLGQDSPEINLDRCVQDFQGTMAALYGVSSFDELPNIRDLHALLSTPDLPVHYPRSSERRNSQGDKNFEWFRDNKRTGNSGSPNLILPNADEDTDGLPHMHWERHIKKVEVKW